MAEPEAYSPKELFLAIRAAHDQVGAARETADAAKEGLDAVNDRLKELELNDSRRWFENNALGQYIGIVLTLWHFQENEGIAGPYGRAFLDLFQQSIGMLPKVNEQILLAQTKEEMHVAVMRLHKAHDELLNIALESLD